MVIDLFLFLSFESDYRGSFQSSSCEQAYLFVQFSSWGGCDDEYKPVIAEHAKNLQHSFERISIRIVDVNQHQSEKGSFKKNVRALLKHNTDQ